MNKFIVYIILIVFSIYFSIVAGKLLGGMDGEEDSSLYGNLGNEIEPNHNSLLEALNPFNIIPQSDGYYDGEDEIKYQNQETMSHSTPRSRNRSSYNRYNGFHENRISNNNNSFSINSNEEIKPSSRGKNSRKIEEFENYTNPFGGLLSYVSNAKSESSVSRGADANSIGTLGLRIGETSDEMSVLDGGPDPPTPEPIPFEGGGIIALFGGCVAAFLTLRKKLNIVK